MCCVRNIPSQKNFGGKSYHAEILFRASDLDVIAFSTTTLPEMRTVEQMG